MDHQHGGEETMSDIIGRTVPLRAGGRGLSPRMRIRVCAQAFVVSPNKPSSVIIDENGI